MTNTDTSSATALLEDETTSTFADLGIADDLIRVLTERGIDTPFPIQSLTIPDGLAGGDVCGKASTGSGKTIAFGIPMIERTEKSRPGHPHSLILAPTRELATQIAEELRPLAKVRGLYVAAIYGGVSMDAQISKITRGVDIVVATPGRLIDLMDRKEIALDETSIVVLDEADQMADMGFLPQVQRIMRMIRQPCQTMLFSATLDGAIGTIIRRYLNEPIHHEVASTTTTVETMEHRFIAVHQMDKARVAAAISRNVGRTLAFVRTKRGADRVAAALRDEGIDAQAIHGDLSQVRRERTMSDFKAGKLGMLVATNVAARGIHVDGVDVVIHYDPPEDHKSYVHRSGRTARAGDTGLVVTLVLWDQEIDVKRLQRMAKISEPIVEMFSNDERLRDFTNWRPSSDDHRRRPPARGRLARAAR